MARYARTTVSADDKEYTLIGSPRAVKSFGVGQLFNQNKHWRSEYYEGDPARPWSVVAKHSHRRKFLVVYVWAPAASISP